MLMFKSPRTSLGVFALALLLPACDPVPSDRLSSTQSTAVHHHAIDRQAWVARHHPRLHAIDPQSPFSLGNGRFAFTADVTGLQSLPELYFARGIPLETKARWAWHTRANPEGHTLEDAMESYPAYGREVKFPTRMDTLAGQWLRENPHDLPLARLGLILDRAALDASVLTDIDQQLDLWKGQLFSRFHLAGEPVSVTTLVNSEVDQLAVELASPLLAEQRLGVVVAFPRGYDPAVKNTPPILWDADGEHETTLVRQADGVALFHRRVDDSEHYALLQWSGEAELVEAARHRYHLLPAGGEQLRVYLHFSVDAVSREAAPDFAVLQAQVANHWRDFWQSGAALDLGGSSHPRAAELERRLVLSRYLMAIQARTDQPAQETGLTNSSWYGKHHSEMAWWHAAHWALWDQPEELERMLNWYQRQLDSARELARYRGLDGARWAKMVGPDNRESPGGNPLIIWNQPQPIHLAELLYRRTGDDSILRTYATLVEDTAATLATMLVWDEEAQRYSLDSPIWIAQEIYEPRQTRNPGFELAYWREGLRLAQLWRQRQGLAPREDWQERLDKLAPLPVKDGKYVAIESIPDTFDNRASRRDHPSMLASYGLLNDPGVDAASMNATLDAVLADWDWEAQIWGWDYPMIAMTAARLGRPDTAVEILLADSVHNHYLPNGHCPQPGSELRVYLPANGALLAAVAMMAGGWEGAPERPAPGFPDDGRWQIKAEGFMPFP